MFGKTFFVRVVVWKRKASELSTWEFYQRKSSVRVFCDLEKFAEDTTKIFFLTILVLLAVGNSERNKERCVNESTFIGKLRKSRRKFQEIQKFIFQKLVVVTRFRYLSRGKNDEIKFSPVKKLDLSQNSRIWF